MVGAVPPPDDGGMEDTRVQDPPPRPGPPPFPSEPRRLLRRAEPEGKVGGVCAGIADHLGVDVTLVRIAAVVIALAGPGVPAYALLWVVIPKSPPGTPPNPVRHGPVVGGGTNPVVGVALLLVAMLVVFDGGIFDEGVLLPALLVGAGIWLLVRDRDGGPDAAAPGVPTAWPSPPAGPAAPGQAPPWNPIPAPPAPGGAAPTTWPQGGRAEDVPAAGAPPEVEPVPAGDPVALSSTDAPDALPWSSSTTDTRALPPPPSPPPPGPPAWHLPWDAAQTARPLPPVEPASPLGRSTVGCLALGAALLWALAAADVVSPDLGDVLALLLLGVGAGLLVGARYGRARWLVAPGLVLVVALVAVSAVEVPLRGGFGERRHEPLVAAELGEPFRLTAGEMVIDLRSLDLPAPGPTAEPVSLVASVGAGSLEVVVPEGVTILLRSEVGAGEVLYPGSARRRSTEGIGVDENLTLRGAEGAGTIELDLEVGLGEVEVTRG